MVIEAEGVSVISHALHRRLLTGHFAIDDLVAEDEVDRFPLAVAAPICCCHAVSVMSGQPLDCFAPFLRHELVALVDNNATECISWNRSLRYPVTERLRCRNGYSLIDRELVALNDARFDAKKLLRVADELVCYIELRNYDEGALSEPSGDFESKNTLTPARVASSNSLA